MLAISDLLIQGSKPGIKNVSLKLYKQFYEDVLMKRSFHYVLKDGSVLDVSFGEYGLYHMLGIHHIDRNIDVKTFYDDIDNGLDFTVFRANRATKRRFIDMIDRIEMFSCLYMSMKQCKLFSVPSGTVKGTQQVAADYVIYHEINGEGMNIALRTTDNVLMPVTILSDRKAQKGKHIDVCNEIPIAQLDVIDTATQIVVENLMFS